MGIAVEQFNPVSIGIDIGQIADSTAIAVIEAMQVDHGRTKVIPRPERVPTVDDHWDFWPEYETTKKVHVLETEYTLRHIERVPLGTSYPDVAKKIAGMLCSPLLYRRSVRVLIDVTGVGRPVYDSLLSEISLHPESRDARVKPITFAAGQKYNRSNGTLGKAFLVSRLQSLLQNNQVHAPDTAEVKAMLEELRVYEIKVDQDGHDTYGAFKVGKHDDLATALALAVLEDPFSDRVSYSKRVY